MQQKSPKTIYLKDYTPPDYCIENVDLNFDLQEEVTIVKSRLEMHSNNKVQTPLILDGKNLRLKSIGLNGELLSAERCSVDEQSLTITNLPEAFTLEIETEIKPHENTALEGLYKSSGNFCTQCEAEGFRRMTYFLDRPDVMARYSTTISADKEKYPVLLSNGNLVDQGNCPDNRHWVRWEDPFKKPSYLFALVAGDLVCQKDTFVTKSGRTVSLEIFVEKINYDKCEHALRSLKKAMQWEEEKYGREYDLDIYMIVAVNDFNMGAMENKGLNVFNSKYVLAKPETATDWDYNAIEGVIAHEYFHNWTGNRITCRDWFQLSLKEGLTVFRDQCFSADMGSAGVQRISDVRALRASQFPEDAGPMAHPVRPDSYLTINNFYTSTIYNKGAEVIRMIHRILGEEGFRKGMDLYFERHDGQAVTTDDFVAAMADASKKDLTQFLQWYRQAGTPELHVETDYDEDSGTYSLKIRQSCKPTPGQEHKEPLHIPIAMGLLDRNGNDLPLQLEGENIPFDGKTRVLSLVGKEETFRFTSIPHQPTPSLLRGFSAPVKVRMEYTEEDLAFLLAHDSDSFNRWEAGHQLAIKVIMKLIADAQQGKELKLSEHFVQAFKKMLKDPLLDQALVAETFSLPSETYLGEMMAVVDVEAIHHVRNFVLNTLARTLQDLFLKRYQTNLENGPYELDIHSMARRQLKNVSLAYLVRLKEDAYLKLGLTQFQSANNMTDSLAALGALSLNNTSHREKVLAEFYETWRNDPLVIDKWFSIQAVAPLDNILDEVKLLMKHPAFDIKNPNKIRSLIGVFCSANPFGFHNRNGEGYRFLGDRVLELDSVNPQIAARLVGSLSHWRRFDMKRQELMKQELERIVNKDGLSKDVYEISTKSLV
ncbi:MAG: aminopeptidase N [SAR324 cluster bacterium]|nr:aminopeptidase N [SAR324 cluster bacterium]